MVALYLLPPLEVNVHKQTFFQSIHIVYLMHCVETALSVIAQTFFQSIHVSFCFARCGNLVLLCNKYFFSPLTCILLLNRVET